MINFRPHHAFKTSALVGTAVDIQKLTCSLFPEWYIHTRMSFLIQHFSYVQSFFWNKGGSGTRSRKGPERVYHKDVTQPNANPTGRERLTAPFRDCGIRTGAEHLPGMIKRDSGLVWERQLAWKPKHHARLQCPMAATLWLIMMVVALLWIIIWMFCVYLLSFYNVFIELILFATATRACQKVYVTRSLYESEIPPFHFAIKIYEMNCETWNAIALSLSALPATDFQSIRMRCRATPGLITDALSGNLLLVY